jgi:putative transposase
LWRSSEAVEFATLEWVDWFNHRRLLEPIGNIPPAEAEQRYYTVLEQSKIAADLTESASGKPRGGSPAHYHREQECGLSEGRR